MVSRNVSVPTMLIHQYSYVWEVGGDVRESSRYEMAAKWVMQTQERLWQRGFGGQNWGTSVLTRLINSKQSCDADEFRCVWKSLWRRITVHAAFVTKKKSCMF